MNLLALFLVSMFAITVLLGLLTLVAALYFDELFDEVFNSPWTD